MRALPALLSVLILAACGADEPPAADEPAAAEQATPRTSPTMADFAGTWQNEVTLEGVETPVPSTMSGSASGDDWTMSVGEHTAIPMQVRIAGDSLIAESAEYESVLRPGVMVTVRTASVLQAGGLMGNMVATYRTASGDERVRGTLRSTRVR